MSDNLAQLDQSGSNAQWNRTWLGPTIGWVMLPVTPERIITSTAALTIRPYDSKILLNAAVTSIQLPDVVAWVTSPFQVVQSAFERSLWIKDLAGNARSNNIVITPYAGQTIDLLSSYTIVSNHALIKLYPLTDLSGWYVG